MLLLSKLLSDKGSTVSTQKEKALQMAISQIEKEFCAGTVMTLNNSIEEIDQKAKSLADFFNGQVLDVDE